MAELQNTFSWSHSAAKDFDACRRRRFWEKYAKWGGWGRSATALQKKAYLLSKMNNRWSLQGDAAERAAMFVLRQAQKGVSLTAEEAFEQSAKPYLRSQWDASLQKKWTQDPKSNNLHEHYYPQFARGTDRELIIKTAETVKLCLSNFVENFLPRFAGIKFDQEVAVAHVGAGGDPEHFMFEGVKVYAIPDYVYREGNIWHIHDWKSGKVREEHGKQLGVYALWAHTKHFVPAENIRVYIEYLQSGETVEAPVTEDDLEGARNEIRESVAEMSEYLEDQDIVRNLPVPQDEWELAADPPLCRLCSFFELCQPELEELELEFDI